jgi:hypothetical protein
MKIKILLLSVAIIFAVGIAGGVFWWLSRPQVITFGDDSKLTLLGADYGKRHAVPGHKLPPAPARTGAATGGAARRGGSSSFTTPSDTLVVWVRAKYDYTPNQPNQPNQFQPNQYHNFQFYVYDPAGTACAYASSRNMSGNQRGDDVLAVQFDAFPRREGKLYLRVQENYSGGQEMADEKFVISNPAAKKSFEKWTPEPLPVTTKDDDLSVTLTKLVAGANMPYQRNQDNPDDAMNKGVQVAFHVERAGKPVANWQPVSVETTDATGNRTAMNYGPNGNQVQWNGDEGTFTYQYGLWPDEPAWKVRMEMTQNSDFSGDDQWTAQNIPVVLGSQQSFNGIIGGRGGVVGVRGSVVSVLGTAPARGAAPGAANPAATATPCAEGDLGGHHIKVFPAVQFTNMPPNYPQQGGMIIQIQPALMNNGMRIINGPNGTQMADDGLRLTLAKVTDSQGGEITSMNSGGGTTGIGGTNSSSTHRFMFRDIAGVTNINATIALHKNRFFEFTVKPEKAASAQP